MKNKKTYNRNSHDSQMIASMDYKEQNEMLFNKMIGTQELVSDKIDTNVIQCTELLQWFFNSLLRGKICVDLFV